MQGGDDPTECEGADEGHGEFQYRGERDGEEEVLDPKHKNIMDEVDAIGVGGEGFPDQAAIAVFRKIRWNRERKAMQLSVQDRHQKGR